MTGVRAYCPSMTRIGCPESATRRSAMARATGSLESGVVIREPVVEGVARSLICGTPPRVGPPEWSRRGTGLHAHRVAREIRSERRTVRRDQRVEAALTGRNRQNVDPAPRERMHRQVTPRAGVLEQLGVVGREGVGSGIEGIAGVTGDEAEGERGARRGAGVGHQRQRGIGEDPRHGVVGPIERDDESPLVERYDRDDAGVTKGGRGLGAGAPLGGRGARAGVEAPRRR